MNEQLNEVRDPIAEIEQKCERAERRARICQEKKMWADFYQAVNDYFASCPRKDYDA